ncbi:synaptogenesis protein syg-2-like [Dreissena polymorpha]|uniref:synaptogenesis protein syg-2-like n=1 Tax=Dreissena polymorpha TaxID=45954 RepID=UPI0022643783|nr:synaptogenesis protein syg-2-like [Dreissena polymorpha]
MEPTGCATQEAYTESTFYVDVQYPANIRRFYADGSNFASSIIISESQSLTLLCDVDSDPLAKLQLVNNTKGDERLLMDAHNNTISAHLSNARCEYDMGVYQCKGKNIHNAVQQIRELEIRITCSPRPSPFSPPISTIYKRRNSSAVLTFTVVAFPSPIDAAYVWSKQIDGEWAILQNNSRFRIHISKDSLQTNLLISQLQIGDFTNYSVRANNNFGSTEQTFVIRANEQPSLPQRLLVVDALVTESSIAVRWIPGFDGGEDQWFVIGYRKAADVAWTYINVSSTDTQLSIGKLVAGTKYEVKMYAENIIGKSDDTTILSVTTQTVFSDNGSSPSVGAAVGGAVGGTLVAVILAVLWKYRKAFKRKPSEGAHYDDLFNRQADAPSANTISEYEAYRVEAQQTNQYETLAETSFHEYSVLSPGGKHDYIVMNRVNQVTETDRAIVNQESAYVNLSFSET